MEGFDILYLSVQVRDPDKVRRLKLGLPRWGGGGESRVGDEMGEQSNGRKGELAGNGSQPQREDWSPINKRRRRLSGSDLDINPAAPPVSRGQQHGAQQGQQHGEQQWGDGEWEGVGEQQQQEREQLRPRGPSWEDQLASTWSGRRGGAPASQQGRPFQHAWPGARSNM